MLNRSPKQQWRLPEKLAEKLKDPEFRKIEGSPIGEDEGAAMSCKR
jgi:hypothetical protein